MGTLVVSIVFLILGTCLGYPTKALPELLSESNIDVKLNENELSILAAIPTLSGKVINLGSNTFGNPIFQTVLQN